MMMMMMMMIIIIHYYYYFLMSRVEWTSKDYWRVILPLGLMWSGILRETVLFTAFHISWSLAFNPLQSSFFKRFVTTPGSLM